MNEYNLVTLLERLIELYDAAQITSGAASYTPEMTSLLGDIKDTLSNIE